MNRQVWNKRVWKRILFLLALSIGFNFNVNLHGMKRKRDHKNEIVEHQSANKKRKIDNLATSGLDFSVRTGIIGRTPVLIGINDSGPITRNIEDLRVGDTVWSGPRFAQTQIVNIHQKEIHDVVFIQTESHTGVGHTGVRGQLILDPEKPFFNPKIGIWIRARNLKPNDVFMDVHLRFIRIQKVKHLTLKKSLNVYDLTLENPHVFFICDTPVWYTPVCDSDGTHPSTRCFAGHGKCGNTIFVHNGMEDPGIKEVVIANGIGLAIAGVVYLAAPATVAAAGTGSAVAASGGVTTVALILGAPVAIPAAAVVSTGLLGYLGYKGIKSFFHHRECLAQQRTIDRNSADLAMTTPSPLQLAEMDRVLNEVQSEVKHDIQREEYFLFRSNDDYKPVKLPVIDTTRKKGDSAGGPGGNRPPKRSRAEEREIIKNSGYKGKATNSRRLIKEYKSRSKQIREHEQKMETYKRNPAGNDNKGHYANAKTDIQKVRVVKTRVKHLEQEINHHHVACNEILTVLRFMGMKI